MNPTRPDILYDRAHATTLAFPMTAMPLRRIQSWVERLAAGRAGYEFVSVTSARATADDISRTRSLLLATLSPSHETLLKLL
jgi:hypothetical protein